MSNILFLRSAEKRQGHKGILEQQAIVSVTRSILAYYTREAKGMQQSHHRIIVPAHIDIMPLLALVADDYTEAIEPEPEKLIQQAPYILYWDDASIKADTEPLIQQFLHPRWFGIQNQRSTLSQMLQAYKPDVCILFSLKKEGLGLLQSLDYRFSRMIAFEALMDTEQRDYRFQNFTENFTMADEQFRNKIAKAGQNMGIPFLNDEPAGFWSAMYDQNEKKPELEPFIAFGAVAEMTLFIGNQY